MGESSMRIVHRDPEGPLGCCWCWCGLFSAGYPAVLPLDGCCGKCAPSRFCPPPGVLGISEPGGAQSGTPGPWGAAGIPVCAQPITGRRNRCCVPGWLRVLSPQQDRTPFSSLCIPTGLSEDRSRLSGGRSGPHGAAPIPGAVPSLLQTPRGCSMSQTPAMCISPFVLSASGHPPASPASLSLPNPFWVSPVPGRHREPWGAWLSRGEGARTAPAAPAALLSCEHQVMSEESALGVPRLHTGCSGCNKAQPPGCWPGMEDAVGTGARPVQGPEAPLFSLSGSWGSPSPSCHPRAGIPSPPGLRSSRTPAALAEVAVSPPCCAGWAVVPVAAALGGAWGWGVSSSLQRAS